MKSVFNLMFWLEDILEAKKELDEVSGQIERLEKERAAVAPDSQEYAKIASQIEDLKRQKYQTTKDMTQKRTQTQEKAKVFGTPKILRHLC